MLALLGKIFGSERVIQSGIELIDSLHTSTEEEIAAKNTARIQLMQAYAPFKLAQRVIAFSFTFVYLGCFALVLGFTLAEQATDAERVRDVLSEFGIDTIMLVVAGFYFGGGAAEGILQNRQRRNP